MFRVARDFIANRPVLVAAIALGCLALAGCGFNRKQAETGSIQGQLAGHPVAVEWTRDTEGQTRIHIPQGITAAAGLVPAPWGDLLTIGLTLLSGGAIAQARANGKRANEHKADAEEGWSRALSPTKKENQE